jgi:molybdenum cofactor synthesis domain-containing protein
MSRRARTRIPDRPSSIASVLVRLERAVGSIPRRTERLPSAESLGRISARPVRARRFLPPHDRSTMDGFAVRWHPGERRGSTPLRPRQVVGHSAPADEPRAVPAVSVDTAVEILTGGPIPTGAQAVLRAEDCKVSGSHVTLLAPSPPGSNIEGRGEDFRRGSVILPAGGRIRPWHLAALAANRISTVEVFRPPQVAVLSTGSEIDSGRAESRRGTVPDTTKPLLLGLLAELGVPGVDLGVVPDRGRATREAIGKAIRRCDLVITIGGSSASRRDLVPVSINSLPGAHWIARRVRMKPGSTSSVALVRKRPIFLLGGPPVAAYAGFVGLVEPFLRSYGRLGDSPHGPQLARLGQRIDHRRGMREIVRVRLRSRKGVHVVTHVERHGASRLSTLTASDAILVLEESRGNYRAGESVQVWPLHG